MCYGLKALDTFGNIVKDQYSHLVSQQMHKMKDGLLKNFPRSTKAELQQFYINLKLNRRQIGNKTNKKYVK